MKTESEGRRERVPNLADEGEKLLLECGTFDANRVSQHDESALCRM